MVTVTATPSTDDQGQPFVIVDWHPHAHYSSLSRIDQTTGSTETLLNAYDSTFPPYNDWNVRPEDSYVYELAVPNAPRYINPSQPVTPIPPPAMPALNNIDRASQLEQPVEIHLTEAERLAKEEALNKLSATQLNNISQENLEG
jgi:hypothetical protein